MPALETLSTNPRRTPVRHRHTNVGRRIVDAVPAPVQFGENYHVQINIEGLDGHNQANWDFNFTIEEP